jgi:hypothetical protein
MSIRKTAPADYQLAHENHFPTRHQRPSAGHFVKSGDSAQKKTSFLREVLARRTKAVSALKEFGTGRLLAKQGTAATKPVGPDPRPP